MMPRVVGRALHNIRSKSPQISHHSTLLHEAKQVDSWQLLPTTHPRRCMCGRAAGLVISQCCRKLVFVEVGRRERDEILFGSWLGPWSQATSMCFARLRAMTLVDTTNVIPCHVASTLVILTRPLETLIFDLIENRVGLVATKLKSRYFYCSYYLLNSILY